MQRYIVLILELLGPGISDSMETKARYYGMHWDIVGDNDGIYDKMADMFMGNHHFLWIFHHFPPLFSHSLWLFHVIPRYVYSWTKNGGIGIFGDPRCPVESPAC